MCRGVNWQRFDQAMLLDICACVGGLGLAAVLRLMAEDHSGAAGEAGMGSLCLLVGSLAAVIALCSCSSSSSGMTRATKLCTGCAAVIMKGGSNLLLCAADGAFTVGSAVHSSSSSNRLMIRWGKDQG
jgi:hypothetical protein